MTTPTFDDLRRSTLNAIEAIGKQFTQPDDDWDPVLLSFNGGRLSLCPAVFRDDTDKELFALIYIPIIFQTERPTFAALVLSTWMRHIQCKTGLESELAMATVDGNVRDHPDRREALQVEACDGKQTETWTASIIRHANRPPTLGPWEKQQVTRKEGRFANVLMNAFKMLRETSYAGN